MGETEDFIQKLLHESDDEVKRKALIRDIAKAVANEIPHVCNMGWTDAEVAGLRDLVGGYSKGKAAFISLMWKISYAIVFGGIVTLLGRIGIPWVAQFLDGGSK